MALVEIVGVTQMGMRSDDLHAGWIDCPQVDTCDEGYTVFITGWLLGQESPVVAVEVRYARMLLRTAPTTLERPDIAAAYPDYADREHAASCGFATAIGTLGLAPVFTLTIEAVLANERRVPFGIIQGRHEPLRSGFAVTLQPLLITALGRTGTTLLMQLLAAHPEIVLQRLYAYETRWSTYWAHMAKALGEPGTFMEPRDWINAFEDMDTVGHNPFNFSSYTYDPRIARWLNRDYPEQMAAFCQGSTEAFYRQMAASQEQMAPRYFAEKHFPGLTPDVIRELYPGAKEIFSVRDFRDMLCSIVAFVAKRGRTFFEYSSAQSTEELIAQMRREVDLLLGSWRRRGTQAHLIRYEDLVQRPVETMQNVFAYLDLDVPLDAIETIVARAFAETSDLQAHRTTESVEASIGRWQRDLSPELRPVVEEAYYDALAAFGYQ